MLEISTKVSDEDFDQVLNILSNIPVGLTLDVKCAWRYSIDH